jgi:hypothetical protein
MLSSDTPISAKHASLADVEYSPAFFSIPKKLYAYPTRSYRGVEEAGKTYGFK